jgi:membrane fusion protein (multidrug efflux system)
MTKRMIIMLVLLGVVFGGIFGFQAFKGKMMKKFMSSMGAAPQTVSAMKAEYQEWQPRLEAIGNLRAVNGVDVSPQVPGTVTAISFRQGQDVKEGTTLLQLYAEDDVAKLKALKVAAELAKTTYERDQRQFKVKAVSQQTLDTDEANLKQALANVAEQQALVDKKTLRAPFSGHLGIRQVDLGQYLTAGEPVVTLQSLDPIYLDFSIPQKQIGEVHIGQKITARTDTFPGESFAGEIMVVNPQVDTATLNVKVRAKMRNPQHKLLPGMYATVEIVTGHPQRYLTLPQTAISYNPYGNIAYLVESQGEDAKGNPKLTAKQVIVSTGATRGDQVAVLDGIKEGDMVVTSGQIKLRNGSPVLINNTIQPGFDPHPNPQDK